ncbi:MAG: NusG domain II-containing protein [Clostridium sp.]|nr:NusG domain II-containing protein [Acetatifactor muris]MCM1528075.1 NusG domain II-containing protein [Bacteroides sp.]MCM1564287.1 NusG domain II-containing protein [Clostridium sp.]
MAGYTDQLQASSKQQKTARVTAAVLAGIFVLSLIGSIWILRAPGGRRVEVLQDGNVLYRFDLDHASDGAYVVEYEGGSNTILIRDGEIRVSEADCPDQTCVQMGILRSESLPIVCLPHRLIIRFAD